MRKIAWLFLISSLCLTIACSSQNTTTSETSTDNKDTAGLAPPNNTSPPADADNTARNADTSTLAETATAQGESKVDIDITAAIRKAVLDDKALSVNAHNAKIITNNGVVTLRGPVKSEEEKRSIEAKARQVAGVTRVDNLLEVEKYP
jgi:hypothetical protein